MRKIDSLVWLIALIVCVCSAPQIAAQTETPKLELGLHSSMLRLSDFDVNDVGVGGRVSYNLNANFALDGEFNFFPTRRTNFAAPLYVDSFRVQGLAGVKAGVRNRTVGVFAKLRPGFIYFSEGPVDPNVATLLPIPQRVNATALALDAGGVLELYPSRSVGLRFDVGDTLIRYQREAATFAPGRTTHNLQISAGVGLRF